MAPAAMFRYRRWPTGGGMCARFICGPGVVIVSRAWTVLVGDPDALSVPTPTYVRPAAVMTS